MASNAKEYAEQIARGFWDADRSAPLGYRDENDTEFDTLDDVLDDAEIPEDERDEYDADNLPSGYRVASGMDYLSDALDYRFTVDAYWTYLSGEILIGFGGPNVWLNLENATVEVYWGGDTAIRSIPRPVRDVLNEALGELWEERA